MEGSSSGGGSGGSGGGVPPGFRFHPTDEELLHFYLKKKVSFQKFDMEVIREVDLNKIEPWDLQERCKIGSTPQNEWYFFSHKDRKYPTGSRTNRATSAGFWKATGRDKCIRNTFKKIGMRKTLVFYRGRAPHGHKTDWIMHEYRLEDSNNEPPPNEDGWVVCRVFKKKNLFKINGNAEGVMDPTGSTQSESINQYLMHHPHQSADLNYSHIPLNYPHLETSSHTFNHLKPLMLTSPANYDHHQPLMLTTAREECEIATPAPPNYHQPGLDQSDQEWDRLVVTTSHHQESNPNSINQINLRSEMDFWAYGK